VSPTCAQGHESQADDYCDVCGLQIDGSGGTLPPDASSPEPADTPADEATHPDMGRSDTRACPNCATVNAVSDRFCERCGFNFETGVAPEPVEPAEAGWEAVVSVDCSFYAKVDANGVELPADVPDRHVVLEGDEVLIGRASSSKGLSPGIDLAATPEDVGVSHEHAVLTRGADGWSITDAGSSNGTYLNDADEPLDAGKPVALHDGDRIHLGAWTTIVVQAQR